MGNNIEATWFDPTSGVYLKLSGSPFDNKGTPKFTPPAQNRVGQLDWVLVLRQANK
jgi:hypothetical protein